MKRFVPAVCAVLLASLCGCVTEVQHIDLTGDIMLDGPRMVAEGPPRDKPLWEYRTAVAALRRGNDDLSKQMLDEAIARLGGLYGKDKEAQKARSYFHEESTKTFVGEPYERVMAYYYRGILYWMDGERDNARACFRSGEIEDSSSEGQQYAGDYALLDYLDGLATAKIGDDSSDAFKRAQQECKFRKPPPYNSDANVLFFLEFGPGPRKYASGRYREELRFNVLQSAVQSAVVIVEGQAVTVGPYDDLGFQATTRGGRVMDHVLANKAVFKTTTGAVGEVGIIGGALAATSRNRTAQEVGLGVLAAGIVTEIVSANTTPAADVRMWDNLPRYLSFASLQLAPGEHKATVEFLDAGGHPLANLTKSITFTVSDDKRDKVVFVSDKSPTPQTL